MGCDRPARRLAPEVPELETVPGMVARDTTPHQQGNALVGRQKKITFNFGGKNMTHEKLKNGAMVTMRRGDVVLAHWRNEFVTWKTDSNGNAYWGHYFGNDWKKAVADFAKRTNTL